MFTKGYKVKGKLLEGEIAGNWSSESEFSFEITRLKEFRLGEKELNELIFELNKVTEKVADLNKDHKDTKQIKKR